MSVVGDHDDVEALMQELMAGANDQPDLSDLSWLNITTQEEHAADYARLIGEQKQNDENLRRLHLFTFQTPELLVIV